MSLEENIRTVQARIAAAAREVGRDPAGDHVGGSHQGPDFGYHREAIAAGVTVCGETGCRR